MPFPPSGPALWRSEEPQRLWAWNDQAQDARAGGQPRPKGMGLSFFPLGLGGVWWASLASERCSAISCDRHGGLPQRPVCWPLQTGSSCGRAAFQAPFYAEFCGGLGAFLSDSIQ